jgi:hypothetical protein
VVGDDVLVGAVPREDVVALTLPAVVEGTLRQVAVAVRRQLPAHVDAEVGRAQAVVVGVGLVAVAVADDAVLLA